MDKELEAIKDRWKHANVFFMYNSEDTIISTVVKNINYLLNRLEAAEKTAKSGYQLGFRAGRQETFNDVIENMEMYLAELKKSREYLMKEEQKNG